MGVDRRHWVTYKPAMIRGVSVNYTPHGQSVLKGGKPAAVSLTLDLLEVEAWTREDVRKSRDGA